MIFDPAAAGRTRSATLRQNAARQLRQADAIDKNIERIESLSDEEIAARRSPIKEALADIKKAQRGKHRPKMYAHAHKGLRYIWSRYSRRKKPLDGVSIKIAEIAQHLGLADRHTRDVLKLLRGHDVIQNRRLMRPLCGAGHPFLRIVGEGPQSARFTPIPYAMTGNKTGNI